MSLSSSKSHLYASSLNSTIYEFNTTTLLHTRTLQANAYDNSSFFCKIDTWYDDYLASASKNGDVFVWDISRSVTSFRKRRALELDASLDRRNLTLNVSRNLEKSPVISNAIVFKGHRLETDAVAWSKTDFKVTFYDC